MSSFAEDVILKKLEYYATGGSDKHLRDVSGILRISPGEVDREYVAEWARRLGVLEIWEAILRCSALDRSTFYRSAYWPTSGVADCSRARFRQCAMMMP